MPDYEDVRDTQAIGGLRIGPGKQEVPGNYQGRITGRGTSVDPSTAKALASLTLADINNNLTQVMSDLEQTVMLLEEKLSPILRSGVTGVPGVEPERNKAMLPLALEPLIIVTARAFYLNQRLQEIHSRTAL